ncbi:hypothetical protein FLP23_08330 [Protaetiibacter larvae]|uniref:AAA+ ATPase domain-containing protein n=1 Tax=Protaetiibacter larvae TaxID=2592654 RepID=A0A5C1YA04_9MICO|nr:hypothetical protein FLP23_08330 [Protaetiibacter larvae]
MSAVTILDGVPVVGVTGVNGCGKTLLAVSAAVAALRSGRPVFSTVPVLDAATGRRSAPITSLGQLLRIRGSLILLDEVTTILPGGNAAPLPSEIRVMLGTLRHAGNTVIWTAPAWMRAHVELREVTQASAALFPMLSRRRADNPWPSPVFVGAALLDTRSGKTDEAPTRVLRRRVYLPRRLIGWGAYDTHADTPLLGRHLTGGRCPDCGGSRDTPKHTAERHAELGLPWYDDDAEQRRFALLTGLDAAAGPQARLRVEPVEFVGAQRGEHAGADGGADEHPQDHDAYRRDEDRDDDGGDEGEPEGGEVHLPSIPTEASNRAPSFGGLSLRRFSGWRR